MSITVRNKDGSRMQIDSAPNCVFITTEDQDGDQTRVKLTLQEALAMVEAITNAVAADLKRTE